MLAIVIPYFKYVFFKETLDSLASQTDKRFKVYIGDDASPDSPCELIESYTEQFDVIYHRFEENLGMKSLVSHWDRCLSLTKDEEWFMILGDDDVLSENVVESFYYNKTSFENSNVVRFLRPSIDGHSNIINEGIPNSNFQAAYQIFYQKIVDNIPSSIPEYVFRKQSYLKVGFHDYPLAWGSDDRAVLELSQGQPIFCINSAKVFFRISQHSITGSGKDIAIKNETDLMHYRWYYTQYRSQLTEKEAIAYLIKVEQIIYRKKIKIPNTMRWLLDEYIRMKRPILLLKFLRRFIINRLLK